MMVIFSKVQKHNEKNLRLCKPGEGERDVVIRKWRHLTEVRLKSRERRDYIQSEREGECCIMGTCDVSIVCEWERGDMERCGERRDNWSD